MTKKLDGEPLRMARRHSAVAEDEALSLAAVVMAELGTGREASEVKRIAIHPNNTKYVFMDGEGHCLGVYDADQQVCRPCGPEEGAH